MSYGTNPYSIEYNSNNLSANGTTVICTVPQTVGAAYAVLHSITINTKGASSNTCTVYDNTSAAGTKIATIDTTSGVQTLFYDSICLVGITVVLGTGTSADITVNWTKSH